MIVTRLSGVQMPQTTVENAQLLESEVQRLDVDIQACSGKLDSTFMTSWGLWRDTAMALAQQAQQSTWYEIPAGGLWTWVRQALSGDGIRDQMDALRTWRTQASSNGCTMTGPDPPTPPMPLGDKLMWTGIGLGVLGVVGVTIYGIATKQGPVTIINRIVGRRRGK